MDNSLMNTMFSTKNNSTYNITNHSKINCYNINRNIGIVKYTNSDIFDRSSPIRIIF